MITIEVDSSLTGMLDGIIEDVVLPATIAAASEFADQLEANLENHRSERTGTSERKSQQAKSQETERALADSVIVIPESDENEATAIVTVTADNAAKLAWLEYGYQQKYWGADSGDLQQPEAVLSAAFQTAREDAWDAFQTTFTKRLREFDGS